LSMLSRRTRSYVLGYERPSPRSTGSWARILSMAYAQRVGCISVYAILTFAGPSYAAVRLFFAGRGFVVGLKPGLGYPRAFHLFEHTLFACLRPQGAFPVIFGANRTNFHPANFSSPRIELHLFYKLRVTVPIIVAMWLHLRGEKRHEVFCCENCLRNSVSM